MSGPHAYARGAVAQVVVRGNDHTQPEAGTTGPRGPYAESRVVPLKLSYVASI